MSPVDIEIPDVWSTNKMVAIEDIRASGTTTGIGTAAIVPNEYEKIVLRGNAMRDGGGLVATYTGFAGFKGGSQEFDLRDLLIDASISLSYDQVSQITMKFEDPGLTYYGKGVFDLGGGLGFRGTEWIISSAAVNGGSAGLGGVTISARPRLVQALKDRVGPLTMNNVSPSDFVRVECEAVGINYLVEDSIERAMIVRDLPESVNGTWKEYGIDEQPSSWTTFQRLAQELGYVLFEAYGTIYFARPSWIYQLNFKVEKQRRLHVIGWDPSNASTEDRALEMPSVDLTYDSTSRIPGVAITYKVNLQEMWKYTLGDCVITNIPGTSVPLMISAIDYSLAGVGSGTVQCIQPHDPDPNIPDEGLDGTIEGGIGSGIAQSLENVALQPGSYNGYSMNEEQARNATIVYKTVASYGGLGSQDAVMAFMTCIVESNFHNYEGGDLDSVGLFQQRNSWGSFEVRHDPAGATRLFLDRLKNVGDRYTRDKGSVCQQIQVSAYPDRYAKQEKTAAVMVLMLDNQAKAAAAAPTGVGGGANAGLSGNGLGGAIGGSATKRSSDFVTLCLQQAGKAYDQWNPPGGLQKGVVLDRYDCSLLVQWGCVQVGITDMPRTTFQQEPWCVNHGTKISRAQAVGTRGALLFASGHVAISLGNGKTIEAADYGIGVVSYNADRPEFYFGALIPGMVYDK